MSEKTPALRLLILAVFVVFATRLFFIQVIFGGDYRMLAERNRFQIFYRQAPRGIMFDRTGYAVATNVGVFNLYFNPLVVVEDAQRRDQEVAEVLKIRKDDLAGEIKKSRTFKRTRLVARQIPPVDAFRFLERQDLYPEFFLASESLRYYPLGNAFSHILGYLSRIQSRGAFEQLRGRGYRYDSWIGGYGLEKNLEDYLRGSDGAVLIEVDARGRPLGHANAGSDRSGGRQPQGLQLVQDSYQGGDVELTVDHRLILAAHEALLKSPGGAGSVVGLDPLTGAVLVLDSTPGFDPNGYIRLDASEIEPKRVEFSRAVTGLYPPASTFKVVTAMAALSKGLDPARRYRCTGRFDLLGRPFKCWKEGGHGLCDFFDGIKFSCDVYFYNIALFTGADTIGSWASKFSLGRPVFIREFPDLTKPGFIPTVGWREKKKGGWYPGDTLNLAIGQGEALATPLQLAVMFAMVANHGRRADPYLVRSLKNPRTGRVAWEYRPRSLTAWKIEDAPDHHWNLLEEALSKVVQEGTGQGAKIPGFAIYGKTGTAQNPRGKDHALFGCYLKDSRGVARLALSVVVEHGGQGSVAAVPVAKKILEEFIRATPDLNVSNFSFEKM
ncbi:MAG: hypothetical protein HY401_00735 [Elusimicrobia bacterium]|nr:hypothetical protein [Elusimicrobiota bacterium]